MAIFWFTTLALRPYCSVAETENLPAISGDLPNRIKFVAAADEASAEALSNSEDRPQLAGSILAEIELHRAVLEYQQGNYATCLRRLNMLGCDEPAARYYRSLALLGLNRPSEALEDLERLHASADRPSEIDLDLAMARLATGDTFGAETILRSYVGDHPDDIYGHYLLADALRQNGKVKEAAREYWQAGFDKPPPGAGSPFKTVSQPSGAARDSSFYLRFEPLRDLPARSSTSGVSPGPFSSGPSGPTGARRWNLIALDAYEYDTNVPLAPFVNGLGGNLPHADSRELLLIFGEYRVVQRQNWNLGLIGSTFDTFQFQLTRYNLQNYMGGAYSNVSWKQWLFGVNYQYHDTLLANRQLIGEHRLVSSLTLREGTFGHSTAFYEFDAYNVSAPVLIPAQIRSGDVNAVGLTQAIYIFEGKGRIYAGYRHERALTVGSDFDRRTQMVTGRIEMPATRRAIYDAEIRYFWDHYLNPNSLDFYGRPRHDGRTEVRTGLQFYYTQHLSQRFDYTYIDNQSNVANLFGVHFYQYVRSIFSTQLIYDF